MDQGAARSSCFTATGIKPQRLPPDADLASTFELENELEAGVWDREGEGCGVVMGDRRAVQEEPLPNPGQCQLAGLYR
ncbi:MAG: hypothetical protein BSR46_02640 [Candidatus Dactylopiibacterium carminicum]|nr:MAG: hypothetical protein BSR46_02640 [Candidatus Dactylopiibacterium carminicum]